MISQKSLLQTITVILIAAAISVLSPVIGEAGDYCGDANGSGFLDIDDVVYLIDYIFLGGQAPTPYPVLSGDWDCSCQVDIDDVVSLLFYIVFPVPPSTDELWVGFCGECIPGDIDEDGDVDSQDADYFATCFYIPSCNASLPCCSDVNGDGEIAPDDIVYLVEYFQGGPAPEPSPLCLY